MIPWAAFVGMGIGAVLGLLVVFLILYAILKHSGDVSSFRDYLNLLRKGL